MPNDLPTELWLACAELAAWNEFHENRYQLARLPLVSRTFKAAADPVLYHFVSVTHTNLQRILFTARLPQSGFRLTRRLMLRGPIPPTERPVVAVAFAHVQHFGGLAEELIALFDLADVQPTSLYVRHELAMEPWVESLLPRLRTSCTHLRLTLYSNPALSFPFTIERFCTTLSELTSLAHLMVTFTNPSVSKHLPYANAASVRSLIDALRNHASQAKLHLRCLHLSREMYTREIAKHIRAAAIARRDPDITLDEVFLMDEENNQGMWHEKLAVLAWDTHGRQLYQPPTGG